MVSIVTDSTCDLPPAMAADLGVTIIPAYVHFGSESYRDGVDITPEQLYERMVNRAAPPTTSSASPGDFAEAYRRLARDTDEILCLTMTSNQSAFYQSAVTGRQSFEGKARVEVVDSRLTTMCLGLTVILAAREARAGKPLDEVLAAVRSAIPRTRTLCLLDTMKYALMGGRLGKSGALLGALVKVKPLLEIRDGWVRPCGVTRTRSGGLERLSRFVSGHLPVEDIAVVDGSAPREAEELAARIRSLSPQSKPVMSRIGATLGVHAGPGTLLVALREVEVKAGQAAAERGRPKRFALPALGKPRR